jgi:hypothetical protein
MMTGLEPRDFTWVIAGKLAVAERIGGHGFQHRRVRREEEIAWLVNNGVTTVLSLLPGNQNLSAYEAADLRAVHAPLDPEDPDSVAAVFQIMSEQLAEAGTVLLVHGDTIDDAMSGVLAGYLVHSAMVSDPIVATAAIQEILRRPLGPVARSMIPERAGA